MAIRRVTLDIWPETQRTGSFVLPERALHLEVAKAIQGDQGEKGDKGDPGTGGGNNTGFTIAETEVHASSDGEQTIALPPGTQAVLGLYINGLRQSRGAYVVNPNSVFLPASLQVIAGDFLTVNFIGA